MKYTELIAIVANWAAILTAFVATLAYARFLRAQWIRRRAIEKHLREEKLSDYDTGKRTVIHLMAHLAMTEAEVFSRGIPER
ncbi:MAG: hypothetical protein ABIO86_08195 [Sphingomonas sp.]